MVNGDKNILVKKFSYKDVNWTQHHISLKLYDNDSTSEVLLSLLFNSLWSKKHADATKFLNINSFKDDGC